ncbi:hypothetical protein TFLX_04724 [Thermoflexales bacterium]|nr:hypothetical protein TFLX_04724 [Thermoflexales bacterium]
MPHITEAQFRERFTPLYFAGQDLPKKPFERQIVLISAILGLDPARVYSESEFNGELQKWVLLFGRRYNLDHVTLRRYLIDERYIVRDNAGSAYQLAARETLPYTFEATLQHLDLAALIAEAQAARELKKQQYLKKTA